MCSKSLPNTRGDLQRELYSAAFLLPSLGLSSKRGTLFSSSLNTAAVVSMQPTASLLPQLEREKKYNESKCKVEGMSNRNEENEKMIIRKCRGSGKGETQASTLTYSQIPQRVFIKVTKEMSRVPMLFSSH